MNRRSFLSLLGLGAAGLVLDPERLLWVPGAKTIFLPPVRVFASPFGNINRATFTFWRNQMANPIDYAVIDLAFAQAIREVA